MTQAPGTEDVTTASSTIYDLGYRRYDGERLGRRHAIVALYVESLRGAFGLGRTAAAKIAPAALIAFALVPAAIQLMIGALFPGEANVIRAPEYYGVIKYILALYCAVIAPDIAGRDQRNRSLTLYFSRAISRSDYALGKLAAVTTAMLAITLVPQLVMFAGNALNTQDFGGYLANEWDQLPPILGTALIGSTLLASLGVVIGAFTPHRAFATVGIIVVFILPLVVASILVIELTTPVTRLAVFLSPLDVLDGLTLWMFRAPTDPGSVVGLAEQPMWAYAPVALAQITVATSLLVRRYRKVQA